MTQAQSIPAPAGHGAASALKVTGLTKRFGSQLAVGSLNLEIRRGTTFGLLGPNGAGKSTAIRMIVGLTEPDDGEIELLGESIYPRSVELKRRVGYVPEFHRMYRWMTVGQIVRFASAFYPDWDDQYCELLLTQFDLPIDRKVAKLSKGMTAKLGLLLALSANPDMLVLDEPTSGLDPLIREDFLDSILRLESNSRRTILFSSHHVDDVQRIADRIGIMDQGQLIFCEQAEQFSDVVRVVNAVLEDGRLPEWIPPQCVHSSINRRQWEITLYPFNPSIPDEIAGRNPVTHVTCDSLGLEDFFKHVIRGRRSVSQGE